MHECLNYKIIDSETLQCETCSHFCLIKKGKVGICGIRQNIKNKLYLLTYGKTAAVNIDPIEKKPLFHFLPGSLAYSLGTAGCNFRCGNCQNFDISQIFGMKGKVEEYEKLFWGEELSPKEIVKNATQAGCQSIAYTYNEPTIFLEYALDTMKIAKKEGLKNVWVSNGFMSDKTINTILPFLDAINIDIKSFNDEFYKFNCGARVQPVFNSCKRFVHPVKSLPEQGARLSEQFNRVKAGIWLEITTLIIPTLSDDAEMLKQIAKFIKNELGDFVPWHISAFSGAISWKLQHLPNTKAETIKKAYDIGKKEGLKYVYAGNVPNTEMENTYCPKCADLIVERIGYNIKRYDKNGNCPKCGEKIEGNY